MAMGAWAGFQGTATFIAVLGSALLLQVTDWRTWYWIMAAVTASGIPLILKYATPDSRTQGGVGRLSAGSGSRYVAGNPGSPVQSSPATRCSGPP